MSGLGSGLMRRDPAAELPLTTGRVGLSQTTDRVFFYDGQYWPGVGNRVRDGQLPSLQPEPPRPRPPGWRPPVFCCAPWAQLGCTGTRLFAAMLVDPRWL